MYRFYLPSEQWLLLEPELNASDTHHALHVLRRKTGDSILIFDGAGNQAVAKIIGIEKRREPQAILSIGTHLILPPPNCEITLAQAIPKNKNMDLIIQKAVELGASRIIPLLTERTILKYMDHQDAIKKQRRWQQIALEACKQSGQNWLPRIEEPIEVLASIQRLSSEEQQLLLIASLEARKDTLKNVIARFPNPRAVTIMIGPEGDFTPQEYRAASDYGFQPIDLGPIILRTETAAFYCLSILSYEFK
jgi:16S rRNA (uracil1498-N3)-methyltransferase